MANYKKINNLVGWLICIIASYTYCSTIEPTASFWDCGEYIATAYKLEVGHPPGAPFFLIIARFFSLFAFGDTAKAAMMVNVMSGLCSAFTILFLFWSITRLAKKMVAPAGIEMDNGKMWAILGSGVIGALAYTFSDSFWFSAVEGEVYAMSSLFTAAVFWAILKWEEEADEPSSMRWLILIAYLMGLSVGVHLLNLLVIPSICFIYYFKKYTFSWKGFIVASIISVILLGGIQGGIIPGIVKLSADYELFFVNKIGMPFNSGTLLYFVILIGLIASAIVYSLNKKDTYYKLTFGLAIAFALLATASAQTGSGMFMRLVVLGGMVYAVHYLKNKPSILNCVALSFAVMMIGYSTFFILIIRSQANTPMDENNPENALNMLSYLNREQYGDWPIGYGQYYNAPTKPRSEFKDGTPIYGKDLKTKKYIILDDRKHSVAVYEDEFCTYFPRMWSQQSQHEAAYKYWGDIKGRPKQITDNNGEPKTVYVPTFGENLTYFRKYQIGYMYLRYFAWNFIGKQNDVQGLNDNPTEGNWITGISGFDNARLGADLTTVPSNVKNNKATNKFYALPFILGLLGMWFHFKKGWKDAFVVFCIFFFTGFAIVIYLNQYPYQPRERDYAYAASFYAYAIWIGIGVLFIYDFLSKKMNAKNAAIIATAVSLVVPGLMAADGWDDHNRSHKTMARDFAINYLNSCAPNAVLFTNGDNDTFPLWYAQEVEGIRTDVRVVNLSLFQTDWYINQCRRAAYNSAPLPFTMSADKYEASKRDIVYFMDKNIGYVNIKELMNYVASDNPENKYNMGGEYIDILPSNKFSLLVDSAKVVNNGTVSKGLENRMVKSVDWQLKRNYITKNDLMVLDLLAGFNWDRPIYFAVTTGREAYLGLEDYLQLEGLAYRLTPIKSTKEEMQNGARIASDTMYNNIMTKFKWGGMSYPTIYLDENAMRFASNMRIQIGGLAAQLIQEGKKDKAIKILDKAQQEMPEATIPYDATMYSICLAYFQAGENKKAAAIAEKLFTLFEGDLRFYSKLPAIHKAAYGSEVNRARQLMMALVSVCYNYKEEALAKSFEQRVSAVIPQEEMPGYKQQMPK
ncbi:MAG: glycosyltransferase family 117 protein [Bacteroidia bacterium]